MVEISIIMPVHNAIEYVEEAINSIRKQDFMGYELIIIDDGSDDGSELICDKYAAIDNRIHAYHYENLGISKARNMGLQLAKGEYICFCDHDDIFEKNLLSENYRKAKIHNIDVIKFGVQCIQVFANGAMRCVPNYNKIYEEGIFILDYSEKSFELYNRCSNLVWNGLYKRELIEKNKLVFPDRMKFGCEDGYFCMMIFQCASRVFYNSGCFYTHYSRESKSTNFKYNRNKLESILELWTKKQEILEKIETRRNSVLYSECFVDILIQLETLLTHKECRQHFSEKKIYLEKLRNIEFI